MCRLKTLRWNRPYSIEYYDNQRRDALALERLSSSPHVINVYGYCGMSTLNEYAGGGNFRDYMQKHYSVAVTDKQEQQEKQGRGGGSKSNNDNQQQRQLLLSEMDESDTQQILEYALNITKGLRDVHGIDQDYPDTTTTTTDSEGNDSTSGTYMPPNMSSLLHYDFRHHNMLLTQDGQIKISDFNIAQLLRYDTSKNKTCGYFWYNYLCGTNIWGNDRAPEECLVNDKSDEGDEEEQELTDKTEIFHLGMIFNFID